MRKQKYMLSLLLCAGVCATLVAGCGGEYAGLTEGDAVSGPAVSGNAVRTDAVSGGAADVSDKKAASNEQTGDWNQYTFSNDSHVYYSDLYVDGDAQIIEYDWKDHSERKIPKKDVDQILYVDNDWVYYTTTVVTENDEEDDTFQSNLWRAPVETGMLKDEKEELLFTEEEGFHSCRLLGDGQYLVYTTISDDVYKKYDLKEKRFIGNFDSEEYEYPQVLGVTGEEIVLGLGSGLACQDIAGESVDVISEYAPAYEPLVAMSDSDVFYEEGYDEDEIWRYHLADGSREKLCERRQIKELLSKEGFLDESGGKKHTYYVDHLVAAGDRLYIQIDISWKENGVGYRNKVMCSVKPGGGESLRYEKELTKCLKNPKENQKVFTKYYYRANSEEVLFFSRGSVIAASGQQIYFCLYEPKKDKNTLACYDLTSGSLKFLTKKDEESIRLLAEGILPFENWDGPEYFRPSGLLADMPNEQVLDLLW